MTRREHPSTADGHHRTVRLTDKARAAIGLPTDARPVELVLVPVLDLPWRDDAHDRKGQR